MVLARQLLSKVTGVEGIESPHEGSLIGWPCITGWRVGGAKKRDWETERSFKGTDNLIKRKYSICGLQLEVRMPEFKILEEEAFQVLIRQVGLNVVELGFSNSRPIGTTWGPLKHTLLGLTPRVSDSIGLRWDQRVCISNQFSFGVDAAGLGATPREPLE